MNHAKPTPEVQALADALRAVHQGQAPTPAAQAVTAPPHVDWLRLAAAIQAHLPELLAFYHDIKAALG